MNEFTGIPARVAQILLRQAPSNPLSPILLNQLHSLLITTGLHSHYPSTRLSLLNKWNLIIRYASTNSPLKALSIFPEIRALMDDGNPSNPFIYASLIKACNKTNAFLQGKSVHSHVIRTGMDRNVNVVNSLTSFYASSMNLMRYAYNLFDKMPERSIVGFNSMISGNLKRGNVAEAVRLFLKLLKGCFGCNLKPNFVTFVILISGCVEFGYGRMGIALHCCCQKIGLDCDIEVGNVLINFYGKIGRIENAASIFGSIPFRDLISWNSMLWGYASSGDIRQTFSLFRRMRTEGVQVDGASFSCLLSVFTARKHLCIGQSLHARIKASGLLSDVSVGTALINMYAKCGEVNLARKLFDELPKKNIEYWNAMIHVYIVNSLAREGLKLIDRINSKGLDLDEVTVLGLILACRDLGEIHNVDSLMEKNQIVFRDSTVLGNALIDMYSKCGSTTKARAVFDGMQRKDVVSWASMIAGYAINGKGEESLATFKRMCAEKLLPNSITFIGVLSACNHAGLVDEGRELYDKMSEVYGIEPRIEHCGCVVDMLARAGKIEEAQKFIRKMPMEPSALIWRMLINACRVHGRIGLGLDLVTSVTELNTSRGSTDYVASANMYAEAGRWGDVVSHRSFMIARKAPKEPGKSRVSES